MRRIRADTLDYPTQYGIDCRELTTGLSGVKSEPGWRAGRRGHGGHNQDHRSDPRRSLRGSGCSEHFRFADFGGIIVRAIAVVDVFAGEHVLVAHSGADHRIDTGIGVDDYFDAGRTMQMAAV